jgi:beta-1,2-mannobiose phosphorylase / 1,2-beta-oligomannan phosphorylase
MRSITTPSPVSPQRLHGGRPVLEPMPSLPWASRVVLNPAAVLIDDDLTIRRILDRLDVDNAIRQRIDRSGGMCIMLFRAQGEPDAQGHSPSRIGLAVCTPELDVLAVHSDPVITAAAPFQNLGAEDARCVRVDNTFYLYYTGYSTADPRSNEAPRHVRICLATSQNLVDWTLLGPLEGDINTVDNKNPALFPRPIEGRWILLHRPMMGPDAMAIHIAEADGPEGPFVSRGMLFTSYRYREFERSWVGAGGPPISLEDGRYVMIYHQGHFTSEGRREYDLAAALIDFSRDHPVAGRIEPLMRPSGELEQSGERDLGVDNVLFTCANYLWRDALIIPYAGADSRIFCASMPLADLVEALKNTQTE